MLRILFLPILRRRLIRLRTIAVSSSKILFTAVWGIFCGLSGESPMKKIMPCVWGFIFFSCVTWTSALSFPQYEVLKEGINVREDSTTIAVSLGCLNKGDIVTVVDEKYDWYKILLPKNIVYNCFVSVDFIKPIDEIKGEVTASYLNIRSNPSLNSSVIGKIEKGKIVSIIEKRENWYMINGYPYIKGWVHKKFLKKLDSQSQSIEVTKEDIKITDTSQTPVIDNTDINNRKETVPIAERELKDSILQETKTDTLIERTFSEPQSTETYTVKKDSLWEIPPQELSIEQIVTLLNNPDMVKKKKIHEYLIQEGPKVISQLESYLTDTNINAVYSIIWIFGQVGKNYPVLTLYFLTKVDSINPLLAGIYLDIVQDILQPSSRIGYFYMAKESKLFPDDIETAKKTLHKLYIEQSKNLKE